MKSPQLRVDWKYVVKFVLHLLRSSREVSLSKIPWSTFKVSQQQARNRVWRALNRCYVTLLQRRNLVGMQILRWSKPEKITDYTTTEFSDILDYGLEEVFNAAKECLSGKSLGKFVGSKLTKPELLLFSLHLIWTEPCDDHVSNPAFNICHRAASTNRTSSANCRWRHLPLDSAERQQYQRGRSDYWKGGGIPHCVGHHVRPSARRQDHAQNRPPGSRHRVRDQCPADQTSGGRHRSPWAAAEGQDQMCRWVDRKDLKGSCFEILLDRVRLREINCYYVLFFI